MWVVAVTAVLQLLGPALVHAQSLEGTGVMPTGLLLRQLDGVKRVLMIGAHPDDEDTSLLSTLARELGVETAYLSLTRGDGGQNLIGPELFEGLGVVRTGELVAARELDGGEQYFTRAFDYGFSKTADEALSLWPREELLRDVVWVVRSFRPQVIVSVWSGSPSDGHGHHQASGIISREAFSAAGDPSRFPDQLARGVEAWQPAKLYRSSRGFGGRGGPAPEALIVPTGDMDPLLGRSAYQLAMESRSQHRSQDMGAPQGPGPQRTGVILVESRVGDADGIFAGIDTTLVGLTATLSGSAAQTTRTHLMAYRSAVQRARSDSGFDPVAITDDLGEALVHLDRARASVGDAGGVELRTALDRKLRTVTDAFLAAAGISLDVRAEDDLVVPGQTVQVVAQLWNSSPFSLSGAAVDLDLPATWRAGAPDTQGVSPDGAVEPGTLATWTYEVVLPEDADLSRLYFLREARDGAWYRWPDESDLWGLPRDPDPVRASASFVPEDRGEPLAERLGMSAAWRYVGVNPARGEFERRVLVVPAVSVTVSPDGLVWPAGRSESQTISVIVRSEAEGGSRGDLRMSVPEGWTVTPGSRAFELPAAGTERSLSFELTPDGRPAPGEHVFAVEVLTDDGRTYSEGYALIDYDHIERAALFEAAAARATVVPVEVPAGLTVGYIMGSGDGGPEAIRQLGVDVVLLGDDEVRAGAFDDFDTIVLGIRAYETREDLRAASEQLLDFVRRGGVVVAQYNRAPLGSLPPFSLSVSRESPRVTDETAPVSLLDPEAPLFTTPNRIGAADFEGWVQERGLYFGADWAEEWIPLLELNDVGEEPRRGSLLVGPAGEGVFVYAALSFFRQWGSRVPGAYRLFANLISVDPADWSGYSSR